MNVFPHFWRILHLQKFKGKQTLKYAFQRGFMYSHQLKHLSALEESPLRTWQFFNLGKFRRSEKKSWRSNRMNKMWQKKATRDPK